jgi:hypothetical protein
MMPRSRPVGETPDQRIIRKAADIREAFIMFGLVVSPEPNTAFDRLPLHRQEKWLKIARTYIEVMG